MIKKTSKLKVEIESAVHNQQKSLGNKKLRKKVNPFVEA